MFILWTRVNHKREKICAECGAELAEDAIECPICGCPVNVEAANPQQVEVTGVKFSKKKQEDFNKWDGYSYNSCYSYNRNFQIKQTKCCKELRRES